MHGDKAVSESAGAILARFKHDGTDYDCTSYARFVSRLQRVHGEWKILTLEAVYDKDTIHPVVPGSSQTSFDLGSGRESYKCLSWLLSQKGFKVDQALPGTDLPDSIERFMKPHMRWLQVESVV